MVPLRPIRQVCVCGGCVVCRCGVCVCVCVVCVCVCVCGVCVCVVGVCVCGVCWWCVVCVWWCVWCVCVCVCVCARIIYISRFALENSLNVAEEHQTDSQISERTLVLCLSESVVNLLCLLAGLTLAAARRFTLVPSGSLNRTQNMLRARPHLWDTETVTEHRNTLTSV